MKIVLSSRGSRGHVNPVIEIASELKLRGHKISLCIPDLFDEQARIKGIQPELYKEDTEVVMKNLGRGWEHVANSLYWFSQLIEEQFDFMLNETRDADVLVTSAQEPAAPTIAEYRNIPHYRISGIPIFPGNHTTPPLIPIQGLPDSANSVLWSLLNFLTGFFIRSSIDKIRKKLHMQPMGSVSDYFTKNSRTILTSNKQIAPECRDWKNKYKYRYTGYCYGNNNSRLNSDIKTFIMSGDKPVYIGFGSVSLKDSQRFTDIVYEASLKSGVRIILDEGWTGLGNDIKLNNILTVRDTPHAKLFPLMSAAIHHGGCGTTHTAAKAGIPQLLLPQVADQFYWAHRTHKLGLGPEYYNPNRITVRKLADTFMDLKQNEKYRENAESLALLMKNDDGTVAAADAIEEWRTIEKKPMHADI